MADNSTTTTPAVTLDPDAWMDSPIAKVGSAAFAVGATAVTARAAISSGFFKTMNKAGIHEHGGAFSDLQLDRDTQINAVAAPAKNGVRVTNATSEVRRINREYEKKLAERMDLLEVNNIFGKWETLKYHQRMEVAFATAAVASVAVGAIIAIATSHNKAKAEDARREADVRTRI